MVRIISLILICILQFSLVFSGELSFSEKPVVVKKGDGATITFTISESSDVEIAILDAKDKVVRHLAAGVLGGKNAAPLPFKEGLSQTIEWDGKDDFGKLSTNSPFKVKVSVGTSVKFGKLIGTSPYTGTVGGDSLAIAKDGTLYIKMGSFVPQLHHAMPWQLRKFDKENKYLKTLLPYSASTESGKTFGFKLIGTEDGQMTPAHHTPLDVVLFNFGNNIYSKVVDDQVIFIDNDTARLTFFKVDGSNALKIVNMRSDPKKLVWAKWLAPQVAFSPDGKYAYYSNIANTPYDGKKPSDIDPNFPQGRIYRQDLTLTGADPEKFYDLELPDFEKTPYWMPSAWDKKSASAGIDVDSKGNIFVCDLVNQEVVEISNEGKKISSSKVPWPDKVLVSSKTNTLYVISRKVSRGHPEPGKLLKVMGKGENAKVVAEMPLKGDLGSTIAIDESGEKIILYLGGGNQVLRVTDVGEKFEVGNSITNPTNQNITFVCYGSVDPINENVYITTGMGDVWRYNGDTGEGGLMPFKACDVVVSPTGYIYGWSDTGSYQGPIARYDQAGKPAILPDLKTNLYGRVYGRFGRGNNAPGFAVDWKDTVYVNCGFNDCHVRAYDASGKLVEYERKAVVGDDGKKPGGPALISYVLDQGGSIRLDPAGNIYVLELGLPKGFVIPKGFEKDPAYTTASGTIYKFTSAGGEFKRLPGGGWDAEGSVCHYAVPCGPISGSWNSTISVCHCTRPRFDVDAYGRLYIPNGITYKVAVRDNADNEIIAFGAYGNYDSQGPDSKEPKPELPLGWPIFAGASDKYIYVGDGLNHRVLRLDKQFKVSSILDIK